MILAQKKYFIKRSLQFSLFKISLISHVAIFEIKSHTLISVSIYPRGMMRANVIVQVPLEQMRIAHHQEEAELLSWVTNVTVAEKEKSSMDWHASGTQVSPLETAGINIREQQAPTSTNGGMIDRPGWESSVHKATGT